VDARIELKCNIDLGPPESNLVYRAAALLQREHAPTRGARIELDKRVPHGAGLGGGSSDAANALVALDKLWGLALPPARLRDLAARIGSDCAFFVEGGMSLCTGRGEVVSALPDLNPVQLVILFPAAVCPTKDVYADLARNADYGLPPDDLKHRFSGPMDSKRLSSLIHNRLQESALRVSSGLRSAWEQTAHVDNSAVRFVSGSGSSIAFLPDGDDAARKLAKSLRMESGWQVFHTRTRARGTWWG
jgi:4-diphosphocytidyl-2-C-methyl-D-erythritol kinase